MSSSLIVISMAVCGAAVGFYLPLAAEKVSAYKYRRKEQELKNDSRFLSLRIKIATAAVNAALWGLAGFGTSSLPHAVLLSILFSLAVLISIVDLRIRIVPNELVLAMVVAGILFQVTYYGLSSLVMSFITAVGMMILFTAVAGFLGFGKVGAGDVKLAGVMGFSLGYPSILTALIAMSAGLTLFCLTGLIAKKLTLKTMFPFAPFMMFGMTASLVRVILAA